jgi:restriction system protein
MEETMARRGFFAELQRQARIAQREAERQRREAIKRQNAAIRQAEQARKAEERAKLQAARAADAERKRLEKEAAAAHVAARQAEVEELNAVLAGTYEEIDGLLAATLDVDDFVDLSTLKRKVEHPPFDRPDLENPIPAPQAEADPPEPLFKPPDPPKALFGRKKKHEKAIAEAKLAHARAHQEWKADVERIRRERERLAEEHNEAERKRGAALAKEQARYRVECQAREEEVAAHNAALDDLIANLGYGAIEAVQEYVAIVLSNSVYPDHFPVDHDFAFDPTTAELRMRVLVPAPSELSTVKSYKYTKSNDEINATQLSQKALKDRYNGAVHQVSIRSLHEVFEADRRALIRTIAMEVGTDTINPATGKQEYIPFVAVAAERDTFMEFDLSAVVPSATLAHLGASVSKNPYGLVPAKTSGIRKS